MCKAMRLSILLFLFCCMGIHHVHGQTSVNAGNGSAGGSSGNVSYSIGQTFYAGADNAAGSVYPGVQQTYRITVVGADPAPEITLSMKVFPNPATDYFILSFKETDYSGYSARIADSTGKIIRFVDIYDAETRVEVSSYPAGVYLLYVFKEQSIYKTFKIIKK